MLNGEKDKITGSLQDTLDKESQKMEKLHETDLTNKEKVHSENLESIKAQLEKETVTLESQLNQ